MARIDTSGFPPEVTGAEGSSAAAKRIRRRAVMPAVRSSEARPAASVALRGRQVPDTDSGETHVRPSRSLFLIAGRHRSGRPVTPPVEVVDPRGLLRARHGPPPYSAPFLDAETVRRRRDAGVGRRSHLGCATRAGYR